MRHSVTIAAALLCATASAAPLHRVHSFCVRPGICPDGEAANDMTADGSDVLYGTTSAGGAETWGTVFRLSH